MEVFKELKTCKVCGNKEFSEVIHLKPQFLSATFVKDNNSSDVVKIKVPLTLTLCDKTKNPNACGLLQLKEEVEPDLMYRQYFYRSATSDMMRKDLQDVISDIRSRLQLSSGDIVVDIGANDCTTIQFYPKELNRVAIEPAKNIDWSNVDKTVSIVNDYFSEKAFRTKFPKEKAKAVGCNAMFYDLGDPNSFVKDVKSILHPQGVWCIQLSYLPLMIDNMNFYDICHEHLSYYSLAALEFLMNRNGLKVVDGSTNHVNGGSLRAFITHADNKSLDTDKGMKNLEALRKRENEMKLEDAKTFRDYSTQIESLATKVRTYINGELTKKNKVLGLGASTKGNVLLQFFGVTKDMMPFISERNPDKVGLRTLGTDIELISEEKARSLKPSVMLVLPWYFKDEIVKREKDYLNSGGALLMPMPYVHLITKDGERRL